MTDQAPTPPPADQPPAQGYGQPAYGQPAYGQPAYGQPGAPMAWGPPGKPRSIGTSILLAIVTLGIYALYWTWVTHDDVKRHSGQGVGGPLGFIIYLVVAPVTFFLLPNEIEKMLHMAGRESRVRTLTGLWILLPLAGPIVWFVKVQGQLNDYWTSLGATR